MELAGGNQKTNPCEFKLTLTSLVLSTTVVLSYPEVPLAAGIANSNIWAYSSVIFVPLENGAYIYQSDIHGSLRASNGTSSATVPTAAFTSSNSLSATEILGGVSFGNSISAAGTGGDAAIATGTSLTSGTSAIVIVDGTYTNTATANGLQTATSTVDVGSSDSSSNGSGQVVVDAFGPAALDTNIQIVSGATSNQATAPSPILDGFQSTGPNQIEFSSNLDNQTISPLSVMIGSTSALDVSGSISGNVSSMSSSANDASLIALLVSTQGADLNVNLAVEGNDTTFSTSGTGSNVLGALTHSSQNNNMELSVSGDNFDTQTTGANSSGLNWVNSATGDSSTSLNFAGYEVSFDTTGNLSHAVASTAISGLSTAAQSINISGQKFSAHTIGADAAGILLNSNGLQSAGNKILMSGSGGKIGTDGANAAAMTTISTSGGQNSNEVSFAGDELQIETKGNNSATLFTGSAGGVQATNLVTISGTNSKLKSEGESSAGIVSLSSATDAASNIVELSGNNAGIETTGNNSTGISSFAAGNTANMQIGISGNAATVTTLGDNSAGIIAAGLAVDNSSVDVIVSGDSAMISTSGDYSAGAYLATSGNDSTQAKLSMSGQNSSIKTTGDNSSGVAFAGDTAELSVGASGASIWTDGTGSHGVFLETRLADVTLSNNTTVHADGAQSDGIFSQRSDNYSNISNSGEIVGARNGINVGGKLDLDNFGMIAGIANAGVQLDHGIINNYGRIDGNAAIVGLQQNDDPININTPGGIFSLAGPSGVAIDLQGNADDQLSIAPWTSISGTIDLGDGYDRLNSAAGVNADLQTLTPIESINNASGSVFVQDAGNRIIIVDTGLFSNTSSLAISQASRMSNFPALFSESSNDINEIESQTCNAHTQMTISTGNSVHQQGNSSIKQTGVGGIANITSSNCQTMRFAAFGGFYNSAATKGASEALTESYFAGVAAQYPLDELSSISVLAGYGSIAAEGKRRIINNRLVAGHEWADAEFDVNYVFIRGEYSNNFEVDIFKLSPFINGSFATAKQSSFSERNVVSSISSNGGTFYQNEFSLGIRSAVSLTDLTNMKLDSQNISLNSGAALVYEMQRSDLKFEVLGEQISNARNNSSEGFHLDINFGVASRNVESGTNFGVNFGTKINESGLVGVSLDGKISFIF